MTTYAWPNTRQFNPQLAELRVVDSLQRVHESPLSGYTQTQSMPGARWGWGFTFPDQTEADRQALEGYLLRLSGREHRVQLWDHKRPRPRGTIALTGVTMGAAAAQFATSLVLAGCRAGQNLFLNGGFEIDTNADGLSDGWSRINSGTYGALTAFRTNAPMYAGCVGFHQTLTAAALNGYTGLTRAVAVTAGQSYAFSIDQQCSGGGTITVEIQWLDAGSAYISGTGATTAAGINGRVSIAGVAPPGAAYANTLVYLSSSAGVTSVLSVDQAQFEAGSAATLFSGVSTLLAGDWIGLATGQLVRVVADATATDAGAMTVEVRHMLRQAATSGSAVTLDRPTALYVRAESGLVLPRQPGPAEPGMAVDFVEVFA